MVDKEQVVADCKRKNPQAMKRLYEEFAPMMLGVCMRYTHSRDEAQDLLHDGFIKVYESIRELEDPNSLESWMNRIMVNLSINYVVRRNEVRYFDLEQAEEEGLMDTELNLNMDSVVLVDEVIGALQSLPDKYQLAFNMRAVEEMEYDEIARKLKVNESTVRSRVKRARALIVEKLNMKGIQI